MPRGAADAGGDKARALRDPREHANGPIDERHASSEQLLKLGEAKRLLLVAPRARGLAVARRVRLRRWRLELPRGRVLELPRRVLPPLRGDPRPRAAHPVDADLELA